MLLDKLCEMYGERERATFFYVYCNATAIRARITEREAMLDNLLDVECSCYLIILFVKTELPHRI